MKLNTLRKFDFTGAYWNYTSSQGIDGQLTHEYTKERDIRFALSSAEKGLMYLFSTEQLRYNAQIRNLRDNQGTLVFSSPVTGAEAVTYVGISEPVFDVYGSIIGYRHDLSQGA